MEDKQMKHLCVIPFIHLSSRPRGEARYCCFAPNNTINDDNGSVMSLGTDKIENIWNSTHAKTLRNKFLNGEKPEECNHCWKEEKAQKRSKRIKENDKYLDRFMDVVNYAKENNGEVNQLPIYLDLRLGNLCNLKCRSCNSIFSSAIENEVVKKWNSDFELINEGGFKPHITNKQWFETDLFTENINKIIPRLEHIYITGGEPSLISKLEELLEECINKNRTDIYIRLNTNLATYNEKFYELLSHFSVSLGPSIDAYGDKLRYIRNPIRWKTIEKNLKRLMTMPSKISIDINCTITVLNILYIDELFYWIVDFEKSYDRNLSNRVIFEIAHEPLYLHFNLLSNRLKRVAINRIESMIDSGLLTKNQKGDLNSIIGMLNEQLPNIDENRRKFRLYTRHLDDIRNESFVDVFPELKEMMNEK